MTMKQQQQLPPPPRETDKFEVLMIAMKSDYDLQLLKSPIGRGLNRNSDYLKQSKSQRVMLTPVISDPTISSEESGSDSDPELLEEVQSVTFSAAPSPLQRLISVSKGPGVIGTEICRGETSKLLDIRPLEVWFPWKPNKCITRLVYLTNKTNDSYVGVSITPTRPDACFDFTGTFQIMEPHSTWTVGITTKEQHVQQPAPRDKCIFEVLMIVMRSLQHLKNLLSTGSKLKLDNDLLKQTEELGGELHHAMLTAGFDFDDSASYQAVTHQQVIIPTREFGEILSIDVHPSETLILARNRGGYVSIWNYSTQEEVIVWPRDRGRSLNPFVLATSRALATSATTSKLCSTTSDITKPNIWYHSAKFIIAQKNWFAAGDRDGWIHVHDYTTRKDVAKFEAHKNKPVDSLAVHPTSPLLLSSSRLGSSIKLWNWDKGWMCTRTFHCHNKGILSLAWNPWDNSIFASISGSKDEKAEIWDIRSNHPITALDVASSVACFLTNTYQYLVTCGKCAYIWDWKRKERVHSLGVIGRRIHDVVCHPTLPILVTSLDDGTVCLWDAKTRRIKKMVHITESLPRDLVFAGTRLVIGYTDGIAIMDTNFA